MTGKFPNSDVLLPAEEYIVVNSKKCQGCQRCMLACSLVHEGEANLSLSRIQVMQNILEKWPDDIKIVQCRQCVDPECVKSCPSGALFIDTENGNIRVVNEEECTGCGLCVEACPFTPSRINISIRTGKAIKCDLCLHTPYWDKKGGPDGRQACIEVCPQKAIKLVKATPFQQDDSEYDFIFTD